ncbi:hypothetical protein DEO23_05710 [Brachybacterium endophyticum]|uniref:Uncharacterized protein n=1 Tax=Brachybacterium endophyticum TaxID=2182385 RepID=A0A2U2RKV2_9MICO|nr:hypothetical protein DEO23_05710 [Brachybacterium endophyticum]
MPSSSVVGSASWAASSSDAFIFSVRSCSRWLSWSTCFAASARAAFLPESASRPVSLSPRFLSSGEDWATSPSDWAMLPRFFAAVVPATAPATVRASLSFFVRPSR